MDDCNLETNSAKTSIQLPSIENYTKIETINVLEQLSQLDTKDLRKYFQEFKKIYNGLIQKKEELEIEKIIYIENLKEMREEILNVRKSMFSIQKQVIKDNELVKKTINLFLDEIEKKDANFGNKIKNIIKLQSKLAYLKFVKKFLQLRDDVRQYLRLRQFNHMMECYEQLRQIPYNTFEFLRDAQKEYYIRMESLNIFLLVELKTALLEKLGKIGFPFEEAIDYENITIVKQLTLTVEILKCIDIIAKALKQEFKSLHIVLETFGKRFNFHFFGNQETNRASSPEWFFTQLSEWADKNYLYFSIYVQKVLNDGGIKMNAANNFLEYLMSLAASKIKDLIKDETFVNDRRLLSHLIDETVFFEREFSEIYNYNEEKPIHAISMLCTKNVLDIWSQLEHDAISVCIDKLLTNADAYESRYREATDVDQYLVPNFADSFVLLMQSMFERYRTLPNAKLQCKFVSLQILIFNEFQSRIVQISQQIETPWKSPNPQLMNALWYLRVILDDWSSIPDFVRLKFHFHSTKTSLIQGVFDESSELYQHFWKQRANNLVNSFSLLISEKLQMYTQEKWYCWDVTKPVDVTPSFGFFLTEVERLIKWINVYISPDSVLSIYSLINYKIWTIIDKNLISKTSFSYNGGVQMLHDITKTLIPLLQSLFGSSKCVGIFDVIMSENCIYVINCLRALALPTPSIILLKDELEDISQQALNERLEPFCITNLEREKLIELFSQRCDANFA